MTSKIIKERWNMNNTIFNNTFEPLVIIHFDFLSLSTSPQSHKPAVLFGMTDKIKMTAVLVLYCKQYLLFDNKKRLSTNVISNYQLVFHASAPFIFLPTAWMYLYPRRPGRSPDGQCMLGAVLPGARHPARWPCRCPPTRPSEAATTPSTPSS